MLQNIKKVTIYPKMNCPNSCKTCSSESVCLSWDNEIGLMLYSGKCISCFEKNYWCEECSSIDSCNPYLNIFKTDIKGKCDSSVRADLPKYNVIDFIEKEKKFTSGFI